MILYTCGQKTRGASLPGPLAHPCGKAAKARENPAAATQTASAG
ncbi:MAG: hypothetical protein AABM29_08130 [Actinomycetota bacterium]